MQIQSVIGTEPESELLREREVERRYKFTGPWLRKTRRAGGGPPFIRLGRMIFYKRGDLDAFVAAHRVSQ